MTGWNLPPGCNVRDLPGNRPEDEAAEALMDKIYDILDTVCEKDEQATRIFELCGKAYGQGRHDEAQSDRDY